MNIKGIIFDLDGTLVDSLEDLADSMNSVLHKFNYPAHSLSAYKGFVGKGIRDLIYNVLPVSNRDNRIIDECFELMMEIYDENCFNKTKPYEGITDLLDELKSRKLKLGILSNKADKFTKKIVQKLMPGYFDNVTGLIDDIHKKPDPLVALQISDKFGIAPGETVFVGDTNVDMQTANNAGMIAAGVLWGFRTRDELINSGAEYILKNPLDLLNILK